MFPFGIFSTATRLSTLLNVLYYVTYNATNKQINQILSKQWYMYVLHQYRLPEHQPVLFGNHNVLLLYRYVMSGHQISVV